MLKLLLRDKVHEFSKVRVRFTRESGNHGRPHDQIWNPFAKLLKDFFLARASGLAGHATQHGIAGMLKRHVNVGNDLLRIGKSSNEFVIDVHRIEIHESYPIDGFNLIQF